MIRSEFSLFFPDVKLLYGLIKWHVLKVCCKRTCGFLLFPFPFGLIHFRGPSNFCTGSFLGLYSRLLLLYHSTLYLVSDVTGIMEEAGFSGGI